MKNCISNLDSKINYSFWLAANKKLRMSDQHILELQDLFLSHGVHHIAAPSFKEGRALLYRFLNALNCYNHIACATNDGRTLKKTIFDLQKHMKSQNFFDKKNSDKRDVFFAEEFKFDFLWIEQSQSNYLQCLIIEDALVCRAMEQQLPIIILQVNE